MFYRSAGILMPVSALPSKYGIGTFGKEAYNFIDFLHSANQKYWQLLPIGPVSYGDSPYSSFSIYAGNPYYIDLELLIDKGYLSYSDCEAIDSDEEYVDYEKQFKYRYKILYKAFENSRGIIDNETTAFKLNNNWIYDYSLFMALKYHFNQKPWHLWDEEISERNKEAIKKYETLLKDDMKFWTFVQYLFFEQYSNLKAYADKRDILIIGDMPIYVAEDSVEAWTERNLFLPSLIAGVPPDAFSDDGQLWGNPVYNWGYLKENSYKWWTNRFRWSFELYDAVRIDHFRGLDEFWAVPDNSKNAVNGRWYTANGRELFEHVIMKLGSLNIIAEDLGIITDSVTGLKDEFNFPGMKVLQFAFDGNLDNPYLPENYEENSVAYTGTHDNDTLKGWYNKLDENIKQIVLKKLNINEEISEDETINNIIKRVLDSKASLAIIPLQDYLKLDSKGRINTPSTLGGNWIWRIKKGMLIHELSNKIKRMTINSDRTH